MIPNRCIEVQTSPLDRASVPGWFAEVVMIARHLASKGLLEAFAQQVRLVRGRFGNYEPIDFLGPLPPDIQQITIFSSGIHTGATKPDAAKALAKFLTSASAAMVIKKNGMEPG